MFTFVSVALVVLALFAHEYLGHAKAIRKAGVCVSKIAFGLPYGPKISFPLGGKWTGTDFVIYYLCPFGAFTEYDERGVKSLPYWKQSRIHASGPFVSIMFGYFYVILAGFAAIAERPEIDIWYFPHLPYLVISLAMIASLGIALLFGGKIIFNYVVPIIPFALLLFVVCGFFLPHESVASPAAFISSAGRISEFSGALFFAGNVSNICFGFPMLLPLRIFGISLDGEQLVKPLLQKYIPRVWIMFESFASMSFGLLILYVLQKDLAPIILPFLEKLFA
jgi:hypothetical protein